MSQSDQGNQGRSEEDADDVRLMQLVGRGNTQAFEQLIEKHQTLVAGTVARMLGSSSDVEDIAQQVFIRVWKSARRYVPRAKFTTWLLKITRNLVSDSQRRSGWRSYCAGINSLVTNKSPRFLISRCRPSKAFFFGRAQNSVRGSTSISISPSNRVSRVLLVLKHSTSNTACLVVVG